MSESYDKDQLHELLYQALETELGGEKIYEEALRNALNKDLKNEWQSYLEETRNHQQILETVFSKLGLNTNKETPGREVCAHIGASLVEAMELARKNATPAAAELVAAECVVLAETKDHMNWELIGRVAKKATGDTKKALQEAHSEVESQEDHHLYHTKGFCRELWIDSLGMPAVLPPPEEEKSVETAIGASRAEHAREDML
jgi:ferritin-like metal-binding protein YciE